MTKKEITIVGITLAVTNMKKMLDFYSKVFNITFEEKKMYNSKLYFANCCDVKLIFCPAQLAQNTAEQNRHQLEFEVSDLASTIATIKESGGQLMGEIIKSDDALNVGIYDPDGNSILFRQSIE
jgi:predicted enzyme related to lactoylglutathione lyase